MAFVTTNSRTSNVRRQAAAAAADHKFPVRSGRALSLSTVAVVKPMRTVRRRSQPNPLSTELQNYGVPYELPTADERSADHPRGQGSASAVRPTASPSSVIVDKNGSGTDDVKEAAVGAAKSPTSADVKDARESGGRRRSLASSETVFGRSASLRPSSSAASKRRTASSDVDDDDDDAGKMLVRQRAASFSGDRSSTKNHNEVDPIQRAHRRRTSSFSLLRPTHDPEQAQTAAATPGPRECPSSKTSKTRVSHGRADDEFGLPPIHRPASGEPRRRPPRTDDPAVWATPVTTSDRSAAGGTSKQRRRHSEEQRTAENSGGPRHHRQHHHRSHNESHDDEGRVAKDGHRRKHHSRGHHYHHRRSSSERRRTSSDGERGAVESTSGALKTREWKMQEWKMQE